MRHVLFVVEGAQDAAFLGLLFKAKGLTKARTLNDVTEFWHALIPRNFPPRDQLDHVVKYPDVYVRTSGNVPLSVAVQVAGSRSELVRELRAAREILDPPDLLDGIALVLDADDRTAADACIEMLRELREANAAAERDGTAGFPLAFPPTPGAVEGDGPRTGIYVFPDNASAGTLETVLLECAATTYGDVAPHAHSFVDAVDAALHDGHAHAVELRKGAGRDKARAAAIGSIVRPGASLSVAIEKGSWLVDSDGAPNGLVSVRAFVDAMLD